MLLRIEAVTSFQNSQSHSHSQSQSPEQVVPFEPLHVNIKTASHHSGGVLLHVGRKNSDLPYQNEKSVSRSHCRLRLVGLDGIHDGQDGKSCDEGDNTPIYPRNDEEKKACETPVDHLAVAIEDLGSKFGTKVAYNLNVDKKKVPSESPSDCETEDDETDDEEQMPAASIDKSIGSDTNTVKILEKSGSIIIPTLSLPSNDEKEIDETQLTAVIQCGSIYFRVTRVPLNFCFSRLTMSDKKKLSNAVTSVGGRVTSCIGPSSTHLITPNRQFVAKLVCAWALSIPAVTPSFVFALSERKDASCPLPKVEEHLCKGETQMDSLEYTPDQPKTILSEFLVLSLIQSETEMLCKCAGAKIKKLYKDGDKTFWQEDDYFGRMIAESKENGLKIVWIDTNSRTVKRGKDFLLKRTNGHNESNIQLSCVSQSGIIRAITSLSALVDIEGNVLNDVLQQTTTDIKRNENTIEQLEQVNNTKEMDVVLKKDNVPSERSHDIVEESVEFAENESIDNYVTQNNKPDELKEGKLSVHSRDSVKLVGKSEEAKSMKSKSSHNKPTNDSNGWMSSSQKSKSRTMLSQSQESQSLGWISSQRMSKSDEVSKRRRCKDDTQGWMSSQKSKSRKADERNYNLEAIEEIEHDDILEDQPKKFLPRTEDGWFVAPKGKRRRQYKRDIKELNLDNEIGIIESAQTEKCKLIMVRVQVEKPVPAAARSQKKDFKRFRKNSVIAGARMHSINPVTLVARLPKESQRRQQLEESQIQFERDERNADALFTDDGRSSKRGIRSFLKPTGRSSRRRG